MNAVAQARSYATRHDLVLVPRGEYESLKARAVPEVAPTKNNLSALARMRKSRATGKLLSLDELKRKLARTN